MLGLNSKYKAENIGIRKEDIEKDIWSNREGKWRVELESIIRHENIVRHIKSKRLSWLGHVERMPDGRVAKSIYKWKPYATRLK
jgi:hypothetical protein